MTSKVASPIVLDYEDLKNGKDLRDLMLEAFGSGLDALGVCIVKNVPTFVEKRKALLPYASLVAHLPEEVRLRLEHPQSSFSFGWSHGKEIMNGKPDTQKGSYYNNPNFDDPGLESESASYGYTSNAKNVWPTDAELPGFHDAFMNLGQLICDVGYLVAQQLDSITKDSSTLPLDFFSNAIKLSKTNKARLLHYFPFSEAELNDQKSMDSWCGLHVDHSMLTGLTSAMYVVDSDLELKEVLSHPDIENSGLYVLHHDGVYYKINIPKDCLAFQIGQASSVSTKNVFKATPHLVRGAPSQVLARNTFAVFMQPSVDYVLDAETGLTFEKFTQDILKEHY
ncbi:hypothetical protein BJ742DRAFT_886180 [Cladochytrium replicatum]|nr:hypothetical protein BJ742DRAFT_886180 [Cladochytrium replicatum]